MEKKQKSGSEILKLFDGCRNDKKQQSNYGILGLLFIFYQN